MQYIIKPNRLTLAQSFIAQDLIKDPLFIEAAALQAAELARGNYKLLGSILFDLENLARSAPPNWAGLALDREEESNRSTS